MSSVPRGHEMEKAARPFVKVTMDRAALLGFPDVWDGAARPRCLCAWTQNVTLRCGVKRSA
jgi:hypothetical protein